MRAPKSWRGFDLSTTAVYVITSLLGIALIFLLVSLVGRIRMAEYEAAVPVLVPVLALVAIVQNLFNRRWLQHTRDWYRRGPDGRDTALENATYRELLVFPWRASLLSFLLWCFTLTAFVVSRVVLLEDIPVYKHGILVMAVLSNAFVAWTLQYFLFRRRIAALLTQVRPQRETVADAPRQPMARKFFMLFSFLLLGAIMFATTLAYGLNRNSMLETVYEEANELFESAEALLYDFRFGDQFDIQAKVEAISERVPGTFRLVPEVPGDGVRLERLFEQPSHLLGLLPYYRQELQSIPSTWTFVKSLHEGARGTGTYMVYTLDSTDVRERLSVLLWTMAITGILLTLLTGLSLAVFLADLTRPVRLIRDALHPTGETMSPPPLLISDDELMAFSGGVRAMFVRLRGLFHELLDAYWDVKDERARIQEVAVRFQQRNQRDAQQISMVTGKLRDLAEEVQDLGQQLGAMSKVAETISQAIRMMTDTVANMHNETAQVRYRIREAAEWRALTGDDIRSTRDASVGLEQWLTEANLDFDMMLRKFRELVTTLHETDAELRGFLEHVEEGTEQSKSNHLILSSEGDRYSEGVELIEEAQSRLDEVMLQFQGVEAIREQIDMLSFQAALVASQSTEFERDFRVVSDEIRDLSERAGSGIQRIFSAIWTLDQQGKQTLQRILNSRYAMIETLEISRKAHVEATKGEELSGGFADNMRSLVDVTREEAARTEKLVESLQDPFQRGAALRQHIEGIAETFDSVAEQMRRLEEVSRSAEVRIREQEEGLRHASKSNDRIYLSLRDLKSTGDGMLMQSRTLRSILERLVRESEDTVGRIDETLSDLAQIEEEIFRNEAEVKRVSAELQTS